MNSKIALITFLCLSGAAYMVWNSQEQKPSTEEVEIVAGTWYQARTTYYESYPRCCQKCGNYDAKAPTDECTDDNGCAYCGDFAAIDHKSLAWVKSHDIISFFDKSDPKGKNFNSKYGGKNVQLRKNGVVFTAVIADTCADSDCNGCCSTNASQYGYLVDIEYFTVLRHLGSTKDADGMIEWMLV